MIGMRSVRKKKEGNHMKLKRLMLCLSTLVLSTSAMLTACNSKGSGEELTRVKKIVAEAEKMSRDDLFKKAAEEIGDKTFHWYATSSRGGKVKDKFVEELNKVRPSGAKEISVDQIDYQTTVDGKIYTFLNAEIESNKPVTSGALLQDGYQLQTKGIEKGYVNYIPKEWNEKEGVNKERDANPFSLQFQFKTWMYNNKEKNVEIDNVWDFAKEGVTIDTMDPTNENVNMDWLIQLTSDDNCKLLKEALQISYSIPWPLLGNLLVDIASASDFLNNPAMVHSILERFNSLGLTKDNCDDYRQHSLEYLSGKYSVQ